MSTTLPSGPRPAGVISAAKRVLVGRPIPTDQSHHHRLSKVLALSTFSSDALSSVAYATEEMLRVLLPVAGVLAFGLVVPLSGAIVVVLAILIVSYRQTIKAYPSAGGAYIVVRDNFGVFPAQLAGVALLTDYVLTVAVSVSAGVAALVSVEPALFHYRVAVALGFICLLTLGNLRGVKESGTLFAVPTYAFIVAVFAMLGLGAFKLAAGHVQASPAAHIPGPSASAVGAALVLHAFASGSTAMTGVEAISNGVPAFRPPEWRNARATLTVMGALLGTMFLGISILAFRLQAVPTEKQTLLSVIARSVFGGGAAGHGMFVFMQAATMLILVLAANTSFADFPRLSSFIAADRFLPTQLTRVGERLVYSNGILALAVFSALLVTGFGASVERLIPLYAVGVFTAFTLSQAGMAVHHAREREPGWRRGIAINGSGAVATAIVLAVVAVTKFTGGAWIILAAMPVMLAVLYRIHRHYVDVGKVLRDPGRRPPQEARAQRVILAVDRPRAVDRYAAAYAAALEPTQVRVVHVGPADYHTLIAAWSTFTSSDTLEILPSRSTLQADLRSYVRRVRREAGPDELINIVIPETVDHRGPQQLLRRPTVQLLKAALVGEPDVVVTNVTRRSGDADVSAPTRHIGVVLVSGVHNATMRAVRYARSAHVDELRCIHVAVDADSAHRVVQDWEAWSPGAPLEVLDSPYRQITGPVVRWVRALIEDRDDTVVSLIIPEFVVHAWWHNVLHNHTALLLKQAFLSERSVVVTSVPYHLRPESQSGSKR